MCPKWFIKKYFFLIINQKYASSCLLTTDVHITFLIKVIDIWEAFLKQFVII